MEALQQISAHPMQAKAPSQSLAGHLVSLKTSKNLQCFSDEHYACATVGAQHPSDI